MTPHQLRSLALLSTLALITALAGCAVSQDAAKRPNKSADSLNKAKNGGKALVKEKDGDPDVPKDPTDADPKLNANGDDFEGDTFESADEARKELESLVSEIDKGTNNYREEFGVEDFSTTSQPGSCDEVCDLSEAICKSSKKICAIAGNHPSEAYFGNKCEWSSKECDRSSEKCSTCSR